MNELLELMRKAQGKIGEGRAVFYTRVLRAQLHARCGTSRAVVLWRFAHLQWFRCTGCAVFFSAPAVDEPSITFKGIPISTGGGLTDTALAQLTLGMRYLKRKYPGFCMSKETRDRLLG